MTLLARFQIKSELAEIFRQKIQLDVADQLVIELDNQGKPKPLHLWVHVWGNRQAIPIQALSQLFQIMYEVGYYDADTKV